MKKLTAFGYAIIIVCLLASCKKTNNATPANTTSYIQFNLNGVQQVLNAVAPPTTATMPGINGFYLTIAAATDQAGKAATEVMSIGIATLTNKLINANTTFTDDPTNTPTAGFAVAVYENISNGNVSGAYAAEGIAGSPHFTLTVTSETTTNIQGTFSGTLVNPSTGNSVTITNGMFSCPYISQ